MSPTPAFSHRDALLGCLGGPWPEPGDLAPVTTSVTVRDGYRIEHISYDAEPGERVPALLLIPDGVGADHPAPGMVVWHQHGGRWDLGKSEPAGLAGDPAQHTGAALAREGYVVLCPDALCFEDRSDPEIEGRRYEEFQAMRYLVQGKSLAWKNILDARRAVDLLQSRPEVVGHRVGGYGHSMGSTIAWMTGPWEPRLKAVAGSCCLPTYAGIQRHKLTHAHTNFVPGWQAHGDTPDIAALIAPMPLLLTFGELDADSPIEEVRDAVTTIAAAYSARGVADAFSWFVEPGVGHALSPAMWHRILAWFTLHLAD